MKKLAVSFEARVFFVIALVAVVCLLVILDVAFVPTANVISGVSPPAQKGNTITIRGLQVGEYLGHDVPALSSVHLKCLDTTHIQTNEGRTRVRPFLRFASTDFNGGQVVFAEDESGKAGTYLHFPAQQDMFEFEMLFDPGLDSVVEDNELEDLQNERVNILGRACEFVKSKIDTTTHRLKLRLFCADGTVDLLDTDYTDAQWTNSGAEVNGEKITGSKVMITGMLVEPDVFRITSIKYRPVPWPKIGSHIYVGVKQGTLQKQRQRNAFISSNFDILFGGVGAAPPKVSTPAPRRGGGNQIKFDGKGDDEYHLEFVNNRGSYYSFTAAHTRGGLHWGDEDSTFVFTEGTNIGLQDYFAVTDTTEVRGVTNIIEFSHVNTADRELKFVDFAGGSTSAKYDAASGAGNVILGGHSYPFVFTPATNTLQIDHNGNGAIGAGEAEIVTQGGIRIDLNGGLTFSHIVPRRLFVDEAPAADETVNGIIYLDNGDINIDITSGVNLIKDDRDGMEKGLTGFGTMVILDDRRDTGRDLTFLEPGAGGRAASTTVYTAGGESLGYALITCERDEFVKKALAAKRR